MAKAGGKNEAAGYRGRDGGEKRESNFRDVWSDNTPPGLNGCSFNSATARDPINRPLPPYLVPRKLSSPLFSYLCDFYLRDNFFHWPGASPSFFIHPLSRILMEKRSDSFSASVCISPCYTNRSIPWARAMIFREREEGKGGIDASSFRGRFKPSMKLLCHVGARYARNVRPYLESNNLVSHEVKDGEIRCWVTRLMSA